MNSKSNEPRLVPLPEKNICRKKGTKGQVYIYLSVKVPSPNLAGKTRSELVLIGKLHEPTNSLIPNKRYVEFFDEEHRQRRGGVHSEKSDRAVWRVGDEKVSASVDENGVELSEHMKVGVHAAFVHMSDMASLNEILDDVFPISTSRIVQMLAEYMATYGTDMSMIRRFSLVHPEGWRIENVLGHGKFVNEPMMYERINLFGKEDFTAEWARLNKTKNYFVIDIPDMESGILWRTNKKRITLLIDQVSALPLTYTVHDEDQSAASAIEDFFGSNGLNKTNTVTVITEPETDTTEITKRGFKHVTWVRKLTPELIKEIDGLKVEITKRRRRLKFPSLNGISIPKPNSDGRYLIYYNEDIREEVRRRQEAGLSNGEEGINAYFVLETDNKDIDMESAYMAFGLWNETKTLFRQRVTPFDTFGMAQSAEKVLEGKTFIGFIALIFKWIIALRLLENPYRRNVEPGPALDMLSGIRLDVYNDGRKILSPISDEEGALMEDLGIQMSHLTPFEVN